MRQVFPILTLLLLAGCGGGGGTSSTAPVYTIGGMVDGLAGLGLVLTNSNGDMVSVPASGPFTFPLGLSPT